MSGPKGITRPSMPPDLAEALPAVRALLARELPPGDLDDMDRYGTYTELVHRLLYAAAAGKAEVEVLWQQERDAVPMLARLVDGHPPTAAGRSPYSSAWGM